MRRRKSLIGSTSTRHPTFVPTPLPIAIVRPVGRRRHHGRAHRPTLRWIVGIADAILRRRQRIVEFSDSAHCLLRIAVVRSDVKARLSDHEIVTRGEPIIALHLWNEHLPPFSKDGPNFAWAARLRRQMFRSLTELARHIDSNEELAGIRAIRARVAFANHARRAKLMRIGAAFGFRHGVADDRRSGARRAHDFIENFWLFALALAFNPRSLRRRSFLRARGDLWMSKTALLRRFKGHAR